MNVFRKEALNEKYEKNFDIGIEKNGVFHGFNNIELKEGKSVLCLLKKICKKVKEALKQLQNPSAKSSDIFPCINAGEKVSRYPKRNIERVNYLEENLPDDDDYIFCDDCNQEWEGDCPLHGPLTLIPDEKVNGINHINHKGTNLAMLTLPKQFEIAPSKIRSAGLGVWTKVVIPKRVLFGPYLGLTTTNSSNSGYSWKIMRDKRTAHYVDARDPEKSNWMRYVNCARHEEEQNLVAFQYKGGIYYRTVCRIEKNVELLVWYGDDYGVDLGINVKAYHQSVKERRQRILDNHKSSKEMDSQGIIHSCRYCNQIFASFQQLEDHNEKQYQWHYVGSFPNKGKILENNNSKEENKSNSWMVSETSEYVPLVERLYIISCSGKIGTKSRGNDLRRVRIRRPVAGPESSKEDVRTKIANTAPINIGKNLRMSGNNKVSSDIKEKCEDRGKNGDEFDDATKFDDNKTMPTRILYVGCNYNCGTLKERPVLIWNKNGDLLKCYDCKKEFSKKMDLINHLNVHFDRIYNVKKNVDSEIVREDCRKHAEGILTVERPFQCKLCPKKFTQIEHLKTHIRVHTGERPFQCKVCSKRFTRNGHLKRHIRDHTGERPFQCKLCSKKFTWNENLKTHIRVHTGERPFQCKVCSKKFTRNENLKTHIRVHTGERPFQCKLCSKKFNRNSDLKTHIRVHTGERPFQCKVCSKKFNRNSALKTHIRVHTGERPFQCKVCSKKFNRNSDLKTHIRVHTGERPFQCKVCSKKFNQNSALKTHIRVHTGERPFQCKVCSKKFTRNENLKTHIRVHTGERPFQCKLCSKKFNRNSDLKTHIRVHTGERPFQCKVCSKKFNRNSALKTHIRVHTGERPFQCKVCSKKFNQNSALKTHIRVHTGER